MKEHKHTYADLLEIHGSAACPVKIKVKHCVTCGHIKSEEKPNDSTRMVTEDDRQLGLDFCESTDRR